MGGLFRPSKETIEYTFPMTPQQRNVQEAAGTTLTRGLSGQLPAYEGELAPGASPLQEMSFADALRNFPGLSNTLRGIASGGQLDPASNPYLADYVSAAQRPLIENYRDVIAPGVKQAAQAAGSLHSEGRLSETLRTSSDLNAALGDISTRIYAEAYNADADRQLQAVDRLISLTQASADLGGQQRRIESEVDALNYMEWLRVNDPMQYIQLANQFLSAQQPQQAEAFGPSPFGQITDLVGAVGEFF